jgi:hypothetical protein
MNEKQLSACRDFLFVMQWLIKTEKTVKKDHLSSSM